MPSYCARSLFIALLSVCVYCVVFYDEKRYALIRFLYHTEYSDNTVLLMLIGLLHMQQLTGSLLRPISGLNRVTHGRLCRGDLAFPPAYFQTADIITFFGIHRWRFSRIVTNIFHDCDKLCSVYNLLQPMAFVDIIVMVWRL